MSFLIESTGRRAAMAARTAAARSTMTSTLPRASFTTSIKLQKTPLESGKDALKKVDRAVSDKLVDGINKGAEVTDKAKDAAAGLSSGQAAGKVQELRGEAKGKAEEVSGEAKGKAAELKGKAKEKINES